MVLTTILLPWETKKQRRVLRTLARRYKLCLRISHDEVEDGDYFTDTLGFRIFDVSQIIRNFCMIKLKL